MMWGFNRTDTTVPPLTPSLADEATSTLGFHDAMRAQSLSDLREYRDRLAKNIEAETKALAAIDETLEREGASPVPAQKPKRSKPTLVAAE